MIYSVLLVPLFQHKLKRRFFFFKNTFNIYILIYIPWYNLYIQYIYAHIIVASRCWAEHVAHSAVCCLGESCPWNDRSHWCWCAPARTNRAQDDPAADKTLRSSACLCRGGLCCWICLDYPRSLSCPSSETQVTGRSLDTALSPTRQTLT
jgi:hypothetical protein